MSCVHQNSRHTHLSDTRSLDDDDRPPSILSLLVSCPDPTPKRERGSGIYTGVSRVQIVFALIHARLRVNFNSSRVTSLATHGYRLHEVRLHTLRY